MRNSKRNFQRNICAYMRLVLLGKLISDLKDPSPGWMSMKGFRAGGHGHAGKVDLEELDVALAVDGGAGGGDVRRSGHIRGGERHGSDRFLADVGEEDLNRISEMRSPRMARAVWQLCSRDGTYR